MSFLSRTRRKAVVASTHLVWGCRGQLIRWERVVSNTNSTKSPFKLNWSDRRTCLRVSVCLWGIGGVGVGRGD